MHNSILQQTELGENSRDDVNMRSTRRGSHTHDAHLSAILHGGLEGLAKNGVERLQLLRGSLKTRNAECHDTLHALDRVLTF